MQTIKLTQGYVTLIDDEDLKWLNHYEWCVSLGSERKTAYAMNSLNKLMHVIIMQHHNLWIPGYGTDHIDRNGLNNQKYNLRVASKSENGANSTMKKNNTSGYRGVWFSKGMWHVGITVNYRKIFLGSYVDKHHAARIYNYYSKLYFGDFGFKNDVPD